MTREPRRTPASFRLAATLTGALALCVGAVHAGTVETERGLYRIEEVADGFTDPWAVDFLPGGEMLVTEIAGVLWRVAPDGTRAEVTGLPEIARLGQGGLLDVTVARDFAESREIFLTYAKPQGAGAGTALARARLATDGARLEDVTELFAMIEGGTRGQHFGSRVVEAPDGTLFVTIGDRGEDDHAQDLSRHNGSVVRVARDGSVPPDNPFVSGPDTGADARPEIWSYGHRNPQGAALDPEGQLWTVEHGARGGDEINEITPGTNYGWPVISYGTHYSGARIGVGTEAEGMAQPAHYWDPSIAPSGFAIAQDGPWAGDFFIGSLKFDYLSRLDPETWAEDVIRTRETRRVRDVAWGPDGAIWFLSEDNGALYRMTPGG